MNILEQSEALKDIPEAALMREMQMPTGSFPQYLVLTEIKRRKRIRDEFQRREAQDIPTVAEEAVMGAGMPQQGIMQMAKSMAPQTSMGQNTSVANAAPRQPTMGMAEGGITRLREGGKVIRMGGAEFALFDDGEVYRIAPNGRRFKAPAGLAKGVREFAAQAELLQEPAQAEEITSRPQYTPTPPDQQVKLPAELSPVTLSPTAEEITQNYPELATQSAQIAMESVDTPASLEQIAAIKEKAALDEKIQQKLFPNIVAPNAIDISQLPPEEIQGTTKRGMPKGFMGDPRLQGGIVEEMRGTGMPAATEPEQLMGQYTLDDAIAAFQARDPSTKPYANRMGEQALLYEALGRGDPTGMASQLAGLTTAADDLDDVDDAGVPRNFNETNFMQAIEGLTVPEDVLAQVTRPKQATYSDPFLNPSDSTAQLEQAAYSDPFLNPADSEAEMPAQPKETAQTTDELMQFLASQKPRFQGGAVPGGSLPPTAALLEQGAQDLRQESLSDIDASPPGVFSLAKAKADAEKQLSGLGATKYTMDGEEFFVLKTGNVVRLNEDLDAVPVTGGTAMKVREEAQRLGADFSKAPYGTMPIGPVTVNADGTAVTDTPKLDISNLETPEYAKAPTKALADLMGIVESSAATTSLSEAKTSLAPSREPAPETVVQPLLTTKEKEDVLSPLVAPDVELERIEKDAKDATKTETETETETETLTPEQIKAKADLEAANIATKNILNQTGDTGIRAAGGAGTSASGVAKEALAQKGLNTDQWLAIAMIGAGLASGNPADIGKSVQAGLSYLQKDKQGKMAYDARMKEMASREKIAGISAAATGQARSFTKGKFLFEQGQDLYTVAQLAKDGASMDRALKMMNEGRTMMGLPALDDSVLGATAKKENITVPNA